MKRPTPRVRISLPAEIAAMSAYVATRYDNLADPAALFQRVYAAVAADAPLWFDEHPMFEALQERIKRRAEMLTATGLSEDDARRYDAPSRLMSAMPMAFTQLHGYAQEFTGDWDYSKNVRAAFNAVCADMPELPSVLPKGWAKAYQHYQEHEDLSTYAHNRQCKDEVAFEGIDSSGAGSGGFTYRTSLASVMYDHVEQNRKAPYAFFSAVYSHFLVVIAHNNVVDMVNAFEKLDIGDGVPESVFELPAILTTGDAIVDTALEMAREDCRSGDELRELKAEIEAETLRRAALSAEQLATEEAERKASMRELMRTLFSEAPDPEADKRREIERLGNRDKLRARVKAYAVN